MVDEVQCCICGRSRPRGQCKIIEPTPQERASLEAMDQQVEPEYVYCKPCWNNISDPSTGPAFLKSLYQILLTQAGVHGADKAAIKFHAWLDKRAKEPKA